MLIKKDFIERLLEKTDIVKIIEDFVQIKRSGANYSGLSPFVTEKSPSFIVSPVKQIFKDFSSGKGGNVVSFLMEKGYSYTEAIKYIADKYNEPIQYENEEAQKAYKAKVEKKEELRPLLEKVQKVFQRELFDRVANNPPHQSWIELKRRGYTDDDIIEWGIGYAPGFKHIYDLFKDQGQIQPLKDLGIITDKDNDLYTKRVTYPIHDDTGLLIGFAGRTTDNKEKKFKWINPAVKPSNVLYNKSGVWFAMHKAKQTIRKNNEAFIVEGYNDVIAFHKYGVLNTVAPCGTSLTELQRQKLAKLTDRVVFVMDPDRGGVDAVLKQLPLFIKENFRTYVISLPDDPDDFCRNYHDVIALCGLDIMLNEPGVKRDGFAVLIEENISKKTTEVKKTKGAENLCELIANINDRAILEVYMSWIQKESGVKLTTIKKWIKDYQDKDKPVVSEDYWKYEMPKEVKEPFTTFEKDIKKYGIFQANGKIYMTINANDNGIVHFKIISNFEIEILQHMRDEKFPAYLIRLKNIQGHEMIVHSPANIVNAPQRFSDFLSDQGNFIYKGNNADLMRMKEYLLDKMGKGSKIDVLGWQREGRFFVFNNIIITEDGQIVDIDNNGRYIAGEHYYIPSANEVYRKSPYKFANQKKFRYIENTANIQEIIRQGMLVHRHHFISAFLFGCTCLFRDIIVDKLQHFPILFLYGEGGTGKDELGKTIMTLTGEFQQPINLEADISTQKAGIRYLAQFVNGIGMFSEFKRGNPKLEGMLKSVYDNIGYSRGNIESHISMDEIPTESGVILTGNDFPESDPLIQRTIWNQMDKNVFTNDEKLELQKFNKMTKKGLSFFAVELLKRRKMVEELFLDKHSQSTTMLSSIFPKVRTRIIDNLATITAIYEIFKDEINFVFTQHDIIEHYKIGIKQQMFRINSQNTMSKFWDTLISCFRLNKEERIQARKTVAINGTSLFLQWTNVYTIVQKQWYILFKEVAPRKDVALDELKKIPGLFIAAHKIYSFDIGRDAVRSSAIELNILAIHEDVRNTILGAYMEQTYSETLFEDDVEAVKGLYSAETKKESVKEQQIIKK
jgi:DNA primase